MAHHQNEKPNDSTLKVKIWSLQYSDHVCSILSFFDSFLVLFSFIFGSFFIHFWLFFHSFRFFLHSFFIHLWFFPHSFLVLFWLFFDSFRFFHNSLLPCLFSLTILNLKNFTWKHISNAVKKHYRTNLNIKNHHVPIICLVIPSSWKHFLFQNTLYLL